MKLKLHFLIIFLMTLLVVMVFVNTTQWESSMEGIYEQYDLKETSDSPISILYNEGFDSFPGFGNESHPYIIENKIIDVASQYRAAISIECTTAYFIIQNCTLRNTGPEFSGIYLVNVTHGTLRNNTIYNCALHGIDLYFDSDNNTITNNTVRNNGDIGIMIHAYCDNNTVKDNIANYNSYGIHLRSNCTDNDIINNTAQGNRQGIVLLSDCSNNKLINNTLNINTIYGIQLKNNCDNNTLIQNSANSNTMDGIRLDTDCDFCNLTYNEANNNGNWGFILYSNCDFNNLTFNTANHNALFGFYILTNCDHNEFFNNSVLYNQYGFYLDGSNYNTIQWNDLINNSKCWYQKQCIGNIIQNNLCIESPPSGISGFLYSLTVLGLSVVLLGFKWKFQKYR